VLFPPPVPPRLHRRCSCPDSPPRDEVVDTVLLLEAAAIALGVAALTGDRIVLARATGAALRQCDHDPAAAASLARQFHRTLAMACPNAHMLQLLDVQGAGPRTKRVVVEVAADELGRVADDHESILDMIAGGASTSDLERHLRQHATRSPLCAIAL
jgi:DNA-binding GntR family transcriptional regulator